MEHILNCVYYLCHPSASLLPIDITVASSFDNFHVLPGCWCVAPFLWLLSVCFDLIALILQRVQLQVKIQGKHFSCGWYRTCICNLPFQEYIVCNKGSKQIMPSTVKHSKHEGGLRKAGLCLFHLRLVVGEVWFVPLTITAYFNLANAFKLHDCALQMPHKELLH